MTRRLNADERKAARRYAQQIGRWAEPSGAPAYRFAAVTPPEPALGTLDERLAIIIRRHGGTTGPVKLSAAERRELASYQEVAA